MFARRMRRSFLAAMLIVTILAGLSTPALALTANEAFHNVWSSTR